MTASDWLIYGATGYTARLIIEEAVRRGMRPVLAGRNRQSVESLGGEFDCPTRCFGLSGADSEQIAQQLTSVRLVLNCAGPFSATARPLMTACLRAQVHYLDITGEIDVIEAAAALDAEAQRASTALIPAVGFDVAPTDCLAAMLAEKLPGAALLQLAFADDGGLSPGTAKTIVENLPRGGRIRRDGRIVEVPLAWKTMEVQFHDRPRWTMTIPWGDVASAYHSTGIGNIEVYTAVPRRAARWIRRTRVLARLAGLPAAQRLLKYWIDRRVRGPTDEVLERGRAHLWGRVADAAGREATMTLETPSGYQLTRLTALRSVEKVLSGPSLAGFYTPSRAFGKNFILEIPGVAVLEAAGQNL